MTKTRCWPWRPEVAHTPESARDGEGVALVTPSGGCSHARNRRTQLTTSEIGAPDRMSLSFSSWGGARAVKEELAGDGAMVSGRGEGAAGANPPPYAAVTPDVAEKEIYAAAIHFVSGDDYSPTWCVVDVGVPYGGAQQG